MNMMAQLSKQSKPKLPIAKNSEELNAFYTLEIENSHSKHTLDLTELLSYNLQSLDDMEKAELSIQMERISAVMMSIVASSKYLKSKLILEKVEYRVWKAEAAKFGKAQFYETQLGWDNVPKTWLKAPIKDEIVDAYLSVPKYRDKFLEYETTIEDYVNRIGFIDNVKDILKNRVIAIQSILKQEERPMTRGDRIV